MTSQVDDDKLNTLKSEIRCILLSRKDGVDIKNFMADYRALVGKQISPTQFGYRNILDLLNALSDTVKVSKPYGEHEMLVPVISENTAHLNKLVIGQKVPATRRGARKPRPFQLPVDERGLPPPPRTPCRAPPGFSQEPLMPPSRGWENRNYMQVPPQGNYHFHMPNNFQVPPYWMSGAKSGMPLIETFHSGQYQHPPTHAPTQNITVINQIPQRVPGPVDEPVKKTPPELVKESKDETKVVEDKDLNGASPKLIPYRSSKDDEVTLDDCNENNVSHSQSSSQEFEQHELEEDLNSTLSDEEGTVHSSAFSDKIKSNFKQILNDHPNGILSTKFPHLYAQKYNAPLNQFDFGFSSVKEMAASIPDVFKIQPSKTAKGSTDWLLFDANSKAIAEDSSKWIPRQVIENMQELVCTYPNGMESSDVEDTYKHKFKVRLDVKKLGFENMTSFLMNCPSILYSVQDGHSLIYPVNWGKEEGTEEEPITDLLGVPVEHVEFLWKGLFLPFVCNPRFKFAKFDLPECATMKVIVADALSPELIWLQKTESSGDLKELMDDMNIFYEEQGNEFLMTESMIVPSLACATKFSNQWHRALICQPRDGDIKVLYIDYGTTGYVKTKEVRTLHEKYCDLPIQALRAKLYGIAPINENEGWSPNAVKDLFSLCLNNIFEAEIIKRKPEIPSVEVVLYDTEGPEDVIINKVLILRGHARAGNELFKTTENPFPSKCNLNNDELSEVNREMALNLYPNSFLNLLPVWFNVTKNWDDINKVFRQAKDNSCTDDSNGEYKNTSNPPSCCAHHIFTYMFVNSPDVFCDAWGEAISSFGDKLERKFIQILSDRLNTPIHWNNRLKLCLSGDEYKKPTFEEQNNEFLKTQDKLQYSNLYELNSASFDYSSRNSENAFGASLDDGPYGFNGFAQNSSYRNSFDTMSLRSMGSTIGADNLSLSTEHLNLSLDPNGFSIVQKNVLDKAFHFIYSNNEIYMLRDELFKKLAPHSSSEVFKMKLRLLKPSLCRWASIGPRVNTYIYNELLRKGVICMNQRTSALPLSIVGTFVMTTLPHCNIYASKFSEMAKQFNPDDLQAFLNT